MNLYLVSFPSQSAQLIALGMGGASNHLMSYAFNREEGPYTPLWEGSFMHYFLADHSDERGQRKAAWAEDMPRFLFSYAYKNSGQANFEKVWEDMRIYFAGHLAKKNFADEVENSRGNFLVTSADKGEVNQTEPFFQPQARVLIDSGAFTAWTTGKTIRREEYLEWAQAFKTKWEGKLKSLHFMNLDVIGDARKSEENLHWFEERGFFPLPIITVGASQDEIQRTLANYDYVAFGGMVGASSEAGNFRRLDEFFSLWEAERQRTGRQVKVHLLGVTVFGILARYPAYSSDSSSWTAPLRFGRSKASGLENVPRYTAGAGELASTLYALRQEIRASKNMEKQVTEIWKKRGIVWTD